MTRSTKRFSLIAAAAAATLALAGCGASTDNGGSEGSGDGEGLGTIRVGALQTPAGDMLEFVSTLAAEEGLEIEFVAFTDYNTPNTALADGSIDANLFQNTTFLENFNENTGNELVSLGEAYLPSAAFYSEDFASLTELPEGASIAIPNDPTNAGRALEMLAVEGLIEVVDGVSDPSGVTSNPNDFVFREIENATLPQALPDVDAAFVTITFAMPAGLTGDDAILIEGEESNYYNVLATTPELQDDPRVTKLFELLLSDETADFMLDTWGGLVVPTAR